MLKKNLFYKSQNIVKKIYGCINCHKISKKKNYLPIIIGKNIDYLYKKLLDFKYNYKYNLIMSNITHNLKNKYILEISKFFCYIKDINNIIFIKLFK